MGEIVEDEGAKNIIHCPKTVETQKKCRSEIVSNLHDFIFHHKKRKTKVAREYIAEVHKGIEYIKEYYSNPITLQKISSIFGEAYDVYGKHLATSGVSKEEYISKTLCHLAEGLKNIHCYIINKNSRRLPEKDKKLITGGRIKKNTGVFNSDAAYKYTYVFNNIRMRGMCSMYGKQYIKSLTVHEIDHYLQYILFNYSEDFPFSEIDKAYEGKPYDEKIINPIYLYLQEKFTGLFGNRKSMDEKFIEKGVDIFLGKKVQKYIKNNNIDSKEINVFDVLSRIRQLKLARLNTLDDELTLESIIDYDISTTPTKYMYAGEILSQILDEKRFLDFANKIR